MAKQSMFDDPQSRSFAIRILNEEDAVKGDVTVSRNIIGVLDKDFIIQAAVAVDFLPPQGKEGVFYLLPDDTLWLYSGGLYICVSADVDKEYVDAKFNAAVAESKEYTDEKVDYTGVTDVSVSQDSSTVTLTETKKNIKTGGETTEDTALPVANAAQAGVMNSATYQSILDTQALATNLLDGGVVVNNLPESPSQEALTSAWLSATGKTFMINRAYIWSPENSEGYTYFSNVGLWYVTSSGGGSSITVVPFTNSQAGIIKGSATDGQVFAEANGTGSVYGWDALKTRVTNTETTLTNKVDKETGKGLSTEDYTTEEKTKLASVETGATRVILDPTLDSTSDNGVKNKAVAGAINELSTAVASKASQADVTALEGRMTTAEGAITTLQSDVADLEDTKVDKVAGKGLSTEDYTTADKEKLAGVFAGAEPNVQADWNVTNQDADAFIKNKPTNVSSFVNDVGYLTRVPSEYITEDELLRYDYQDANDVAAAVASKADTADLADVAFSGDYGDLDNTPTIPTLYGTTGQNSNGAMTQKATTDALTGLQTSLEGRIGTVETALGDKVDSDDLATVATTGSYTDLLNKPTEYVLPTASSNQLGGVKVGAGLAIDGNGTLSATGGGTADSVYWGHVQGDLSDQTDLQDALDEKANDADLAVVAKSGDYADLTNTPAPYSLPMASANTLGGIKVGDNLSIDNTGKLSVDGDFQTLYNTTGQNTDGSMTQRATTDALAGKADKSELPTKVSELTNDSGFITKNVSDLANYTTTADLTTQLATKANTSYVNTELNKKADKSALDDYTKTEDLADVATSGLYSDLIGTPAPYALPTASDTVLGGVKIGDNLSIDSNGVLSADAQPAVLYGSTGQNTDGAMTQKAASDALDGKLDDTTTFWGQTVNNGAVNGYLTVNTRFGDLTIGEYLAMNKPAIRPSSGGGLDLMGANGVNFAVSGDQRLNVLAGKITAREPLWMASSSTATKNQIKYLADGTDTSDAATVGQLNTALADYTPSANLASVATSGSYNDLEDLPSIPTKVSDLTNDTGFITNSVNNLTNYYKKSETYTKSEVNGLIAGIPDWTVEVVQTLPQTGQERVIYLVPSEGADDNYDEYIWVASLNKFDKIGDTKIDLTNYYTKSEVNTLLTGKQNILSQGTGITISGNNTISVNTNTIATKSSVDSLTTRVSTAESDIDDLQTDLGSAQSSIGQLQTDLGVAEGKLATIASGAEVNVQSDWNQTSNSADDYIKNKPTKLSQFTNDSNYVNATTLAGYGYQTASDVSTAIAGKANTADLATVATSGSYNDLVNKPDIPVATSDLLNDSNFVSDANYVHIDNNFTNALKNKLDGIAAGAEVNVQSDWNVADSTSDAYIKNKPSVPVITYTASTETLNIL